MNRTPFLHIVVLVSFFANLLGPLPAQAGEMVMPVMPTPGVMVSLSPQFIPAHLKGLSIHPDNALQFDFLIHKGDGNLDDAQKREEYSKLVKYFLASLTIPDQDQWVNLSPYEKNRIIQDSFGKTEMGRDLLSQDYLLKQITSSLMYPESGMGKDFWDKVYERAFKEYGTTDIPVNTFNKVWIVPDEAVVYESGNTAYVLKSHLKVMLEEDYVSLQHNSLSSSFGTDRMAKEKVGQVSTVTSKVVKEIILPEIEKEVNTGKNFAMLRQIYSSMILATWYKKALKESLLGKVYANKAKVAGVDQDPKSNQEIYEKYVQAFKKGVYNYIKEDEDKYTHQTLPRKYFAGGFERSNQEVRVVTKDTVSRAMITPEEQAVASGDIESATVYLDQADGAMTARQAVAVGAAALALTSGYLALSTDVSLKEATSDRPVAVLKPKESGEVSILSGQAALLFISKTGGMELVKIDGRNVKAVVAEAISKAGEGYAVHLFRDASKHADTWFATLQYNNPGLKDLVDHRLVTAGNPHQNVSSNDLILTVGSDSKVSLFDGNMVTRNPYSRRIQPPYLKYSIIKGVLVKDPAMSSSSEIRRYTSVEGTDVVFSGVLPASVSVYPFLTTGTIAHLGIAELGLLVAQGKIESRLEGGRFLFSWVKGQQEAWQASAIKYRFERLSSQKEQIHPYTGPISLLLPDATVLKVVKDGASVYKLEGPKGFSVELKNGEELSIGRKNPALSKLALGASVSGEHLRLKVDGDKVILSDGGIGKKSSNGTYVYVPDQAMTATIGWEVTRAAGYSNLPQQERLENLKTNFITARYSSIPVFMDRVLQMRKDLKAGGADFISLSQVAQMGGIDNLAEYGASHVIDAETGKVREMPADATLEQIYIVFDRGIGEENPSTSGYDLMVYSPQVKLGGMDVRDIHAVSGYDNEVTDRQGLENVASYVTRMAPRVSFRKAFAEHIGENLAPGTEFVPLSRNWQSLSDLGYTEALNINTGVVEDVTGVALDKLFTAVDHDTQGTALRTVSRIIFYSPDGAMLALDVAKSVIDEYGLKGELGIDLNAFQSVPEIVTALEDRIRAVVGGASRLRGFALSDKLHLLNEARTIISGKGYFSPKVSLISSLKEGPPEFLREREERLDHSPVKETRGGIDLDSANLNLQIKRDGNGVPLPLSQQNMEQLQNIEGFVPVIINIVPVSSLPIFS